MMKLKDIKVCILRIEGTNCEQETYHAFKNLKVTPEFVHLNHLVRKYKSLFDYQILMIPGGFSAGDYIRAGAICAARMKTELRKDLIKFIDEGNPVCGICNGFQILVELGVLPGFGVTMSRVPQAVLTINDSGRFECRPTFLKHENSGLCIFTRKIKRNKVVMFPSAHAEGKFMFPKEKKNRYLQRLLDNDQIVFRYVNPTGKYASYPWNPNNSLYNIAGICNESGTVFGIMPHPERAFFRYQYPNWTREPGSTGDGKLVFESVIEYVRKR
jgi:phosphoribosylformylglycinamidine synthase